MCFSRYIMYQELKFKSDQFLLELTHSLEIVLAQSNDHNSTKQRALDSSSFHYFFPKTILSIKKAIFVSAGKNWTEIQTGAKREINKSLAFFAFLLAPLCDWRCVWISKAQTNMTPFIHFSVFNLWQKVRLLSLSHHKVYFQSKDMKCDDP